MKIIELKNQSKYIDIWEKMKLHILQSWNWGEIKQFEGWAIKRLVFMENENPVSVISVQVKTTIGIKYGYIPKLKNIQIKQISIEDLKRFLIENYQLDFVLVEFDENIQSEIVKKMSVYPYQIQPSQTIRINLTKSLAEIESELKPKYRRNIKKAVRDGVEITIESQGERVVSEFWEVLEQVFKNTKYLSRSQKYFDNVWEYLRRQNLALIGVAREKNELLGAYFVALDEKGAYELYGGVTMKGREKEAGYLLKWELIKYCKELGKDFYDHWGVAPKINDGEFDPKHELYNISLFKEGFGGHYLAFPRIRIWSFNNWKKNMMLLGTSVNQLNVKLKKMFKS